MKKKNQQCKWPDNTCQCKECNKLQFFEIWHGKQEACLFSPETTTPVTYKIFTHTVYNKPMNLVASFRSTYLEARIIYEDIINSR